MELLSRELPWAGRCGFESSSSNRDSVSSIRRERVSVSSNVRFIGGISVSRSGEEEGAFVAPRLRSRCMRLLACRRTLLIRRSNALTEA